MKSKNLFKNAYVTEYFSVLNKVAFLSIFAIVIFLRVYVKVHLVLFL